MYGEVEEHTYSRHAPESIKVIGLLYSELHLLK